MSFKTPIDEQEMEVSWERSYLWGLWERKLYVKGLYNVCERIINVIKKKGI